jgi:hypothetical protein
MKLGAGKMEFNGLFMKLFPELESCMAADMATSLFEPSFA